MSSYQQWLAVGNIGSEIEMRYTPTGTPVSNFRFAVNKSWVGQDGQRQEKTTWVKVSCWNKLAEFASTHLGKGRKIMIIGEIEGADGYVDREGKAAASILIKANEIRFMDSKTDGDGNYQARQPSVNGGSAAQDAPVDIDSIPF